MKKNKFVKFEDGKARIFVSADPSFLSGPGVYLNPDLSAVKGRGPEFWQEKNGKIVLIDDIEVISKSIKQSKYDYIIDQKAEALEARLLKLIKENTRQDELVSQEILNRLAKLEHVPPVLVQEIKESEVVVQPESDLKLRLHVMAALIIALGIVTLLLAL
tara:strand:+ start:177 stop:656 length:480 start_codon:yes stop_codon:yes gene_type:complete